MGSGKPAGDGSEGQTPHQRSLRDHGAGQALHLDEVVVLVYRGPRSYTREDVVEIQGHGGRVAARRILGTVLSAGARLAEPGEFTRRAFLNGRIDLLQAEAVADLIAARSDRAADAALEQLEGSLSDSFRYVYDALLGVAADLAATLDFSEDELPDHVLPDIRGRLGGVVETLGALVATWEEGHLLREGALVAIAGRPNVGKSTLMNRLLGLDRAIVTDVPGTTRDTIEEQLVIDGVPLRLVDTAGLREVDCRVEREGINRAEATLRSADIVLYVLDASQEMDSRDRETLQSLREGQTLNQGSPRGLRAERALVVLNKTDLGIRIEAVDVAGFRSVKCSLLEDTDTDAVRSGIRTLLDEHIAGPPHAVISERHRQCIQNALNVLNEATPLLAPGNDDMIVPAADLVREAMEAIGAVTGRVYTDDVLDRVFGRFCVGK